MVYDAWSGCGVDGKGQDGVNIKWRCMVVVILVTCGDYRAAQW